MEEPPSKKRRTQGSGRHQKEWELLQAADHFSDLVKVMFPDSQTAKEFACRRTKATMIVKESLARGYTQDVIQYCRTHPFTLMIDESNDRTTKKRLVVLAHFFDGENTNTRLLDLPELASGTAASIFAVIDNILQENDIPWSNVVGFASDNCNTMVGKKNSVLSRIKEKNGAVFSVGCICHLGNLCVKDGLKTLPVNIDDLLVDIFYFFKNSSKRIEDFKEFQDFTNSEQEKILKHCPTRWLSLQKVVERTLSQYEALKSYFASHADVERAGKVKSIHDRLQDPVTLLTLHFLSFILPQINQFNIVFQTEACMIGDLLPEMERLLKKLLVKFVQMEHVKSADSLLAVAVTNRCLQHEESRLAVGLGTRALFQDTNEEDEIRQSITPAMQATFFSSVRSFYEAVVTKMIQKFPFENTILSDLVVLDPRKREMLDYTSIVKLANKFTPDFDQEQLKDEWEDYQLIPDDLLPQKSQDGQPIRPETFWPHVFKMKTGLGLDRFPLMRKMYLILLSLPHSNADSERVFSHVRKIHTEYRKTMGTDTLTSLLQMKLNCDNCSSQVRPSLEQIKSAKSCTLAYNRKH
ncbi:zinc finger protein 862-like isoform X2 [Vanacampus margaritifer]